MSRQRQKAIKAYLAYWAKDLTRAHHEVDCANPDCDERLKIAKPMRGSGETWDSLAQCPYCSGLFFYKSQPLRIEMAFKGVV